jgi:hypothetical protein
MRYCIKCQTEKSVSEFGRRSRAKDGLASECKACVNAQHYVWCKQNPEKRRRYVKTWTQKNPERRREVCRTYYAKNREHLAERQAAYFARHPGRQRETILRHKYGLEPEQFKALMEKFAHRCGACGTQNDLCVDHVPEPFRVRGILCRRCNFAAGYLLDNPDFCRKLAAYLETST